MCLLGILRPLQEIESSISKFAVMSNNFDFMVQLPRVIHQMLNRRRTDIAHLAVLAIGTRVLVVMTNEGHTSAMVWIHRKRNRLLRPEALAQRNYQSAVLAGCINLGKLLHCARFRPHTNHKPPATTSRIMMAYTLPSGPVVPPLHIGAPTG